MHRRRLDSLERQAARLSHAGFVLLMELKRVPFYLRSHWFDQRSDDELQSIIEADAGFKLDWNQVSDEDLRLLASGSLDIRQELKL